MLWWCYLAFDAVVSCHHLEQKGTKTCLKRSEKHAEHPTMSLWVGLSKKKLYMNHPCVDKSNLIKCSLGLKAVYSSRHKKRCIPTSLSEEQDFSCSSQTRFAATVGTNRPSRDDAKLKPVTSCIRNDTFRKTLKRCTTKQNTSSKQQQTMKEIGQIALQRKISSEFASESKRRCLSSLSFSPLNLSLIHPVTNPFQEETPSCHHQRFAHLTTWHTTMPQQKLKPQTSKSKPCKPRETSKFASESKRRCLSSLSFSPLNLSLIHPVTNPFQEETPSCHHQRFAHLTTWHITMPQQKLEPQTSKRLPCKPRVSSKFASESKRRCLSSLSFSPLN